MSINDCLSIAGNVSAIVTAVVAVWAWYKYRKDESGRVEALERYLAAEKDRRVDKGQRTIVNIMARVSMTEEQVLRAAFASKRIRAVLRKDDVTNLATDMLLEFTG